MEADGKRTRADDDSVKLRALPSVERLASQVQGAPRHLAVAAAREVIAALRARIRAGGSPRQDDLPERVAELAQRMSESSLRRVINATGIVLHTNLGRAPLAPEAAEAAAWIARGYSNVEYDAEAGERGHRGDHVSGLLCQLSGAQAALAVNNNAAAVLLALAATVSGKEVLISRGQLVEIGGSFRIPDVLDQSGATLVEVGTTNRTRLADYERAIGPSTGAILRVHQSNFRTVGFVEDVPPAELTHLARDRGLALIDDLGSGALHPIADEPELRTSVDAGSDLVCCSADKLLGGPQAGIICGRGEAVERCRRHPLARAVRLDKLQLAALEATLRVHRDHGRTAIPVLRMLAASKEELGARAKRMAEAIGAASRVGPSTSRPGGGALPLLELEGPVCLVAPGDVGADGLSARLRRSDPPIVARISEGEIVLDPRTMTDEEAEVAARAVRTTLETSERRA